MLRFRRTCTAVFCLAAFFAASGASSHAATVAGGYSHSIVIRADGSLRSWGDDAVGQLGAARALRSPLPGPVTGLTDVTAITAGYTHAAALRRDGTVWVWGEIQLGEGGSGPTLPTPAQVRELSAVTAIAAGGGHTAALRTDGSVWTWGGNFYGQLGDGTRNARWRPAPVSGVEGAVAIAAGGVQTLALKGDGTVLEWGYECYGFICVGLPPFSSRPRAVGGLSGVVAIAAGLQHNLALKSDGTVWGWGKAANGALGETSGNISVPARIPGLEDIVAISAFGQRSLALRRDGAVFEFGFRDSIREEPVRTPTVVAGLVNIRAISTSGGHSLALRSDGTVWAWGANGEGQLGDGTFTDRLAPAQVMGLPAISAIVAAGQFSLALSVDGGVRAWGDNAKGSLGDGVPSNRSTPTEVIALAGAIAVAGGAEFHPHSVALKSDGTVWTWGSADSGLLGDGSTRSRSQPMPVPGLAGVVGISAASHTLAVRSDGRVLAWGSNLDGELGDGSQERRSTPVVVRGLVGAVQVAACQGWSLALLSDGSVSAWGSNYFGQLGDGGGYARPDAAPVPGVSGAVQVACTGRHGYAVRADGSVLRWGSDESWQGVPGGMGSLPRAAPFAGLDGVRAIAASTYHALALRFDGTVWAWGSNSEGQLADGTTVDRPIPQPVAGLTDVVDIAAGVFHSLATRRDGTVFAWGSNSWGAIGDGTYAVRARPVVVLRENGAGTIGGNDWFLDIDPRLPKMIPADKVPAFTMRTTGTVASTAATVVAEVKFRGQDVGKPIHVFAYAPAALVAGPKNDHEACVLAQLNADGTLIAASGADLSSYVNNVLTSQGQSVTILDHVATGNVAGATFCVGTGSNGAESIQATNSQCSATIPASQICLPPAGGTAPPRLATLENPTDGSYHSGIGLISGWSCQGPIAITVDGVGPVAVPYGSPRADTAPACGVGNTNNGFGLLVNFNNFGPGTHRMQLLVNGVASGAPSTFTVTVPSGEFMTGLSRQLEVADFPSAGRTTRLVWQQSLQNFSIQCVTSGAAGAECLAPDATATPHTRSSLENPGPGSFHSGIGLISGWSCEGPITITVDGSAPVSVPYGSPRADTAPICGAANINTGFGLLVNFNNFGAGTHQIQLHVNGVARGTPLRFRVTVPSGEFMTGLSREAPVVDFPAPGRSGVLTWQQSLQNFSIRSVTP